jgi:lysophospholipase L1-like esterase
MKTNQIGRRSLNLTDTEKESQEKKQNWFEQNPKKTVFFTLMLLAFCIMFGTEKYLAGKNPKFTGLWDTPEYGRYIRLREFAPMIYTGLVPSDGYLSGKDSLEKKQYMFRTDENGFIMPSKVHQDPDITLAFLGGSTTECLYVTEGLRFPFFAGKLLGNKLKKKVVSYNAGRSGNTTLHSINILLNKLIPLKPDAVVMKHAINDLVILLLDDSYYNDNPTRSTVLFAYSSKDIHTFKEFMSALKTFLLPNTYEVLRKTFVPGATDEFAHTRGKQVKLNKERLANEFKANLQIFIDICRARGIKPILMTQSNRFKESQLDRVIKYRVAKVKADHGLEYKDFKEVYDLFNETTREVGKENGVLVIDLAKRVQQDKKYMYDSYHFNDYGSKYVSEIIADELAKLFDSLEK